MGSVYAGLLGKAGHEVWAIDRWQEHIDAIAGSGLAVSGASGSYVVDNLHVGRSASDAGTCDLFVIATKAADVDAAAAEIAPLLEPDSIVMALQNGLGAGERVARRIPETHIVIGIAEGFGSSIPEPGHVHHEGMRLIRIAEMKGGKGHLLCLFGEIRADAATANSEACTSGGDVLVVETVGDEMRVSIDGKPVGYLKSSGIGHPTKSKIELGVAGKDGYFDDIKVWNAEPAKR